MANRFFYVGLTEPAVKIVVWNRTIPLKPAYVRPGGYANT